MHIRSRGEMRNQQAFLAFLALSIFADSNHFSANFLLILHFAIISAQTTESLPFWGSLTAVIV